jgi:hypothetical protein
MAAALVAIIGLLPRRRRLSLELLLTPAVIRSIVLIILLLCLFGNVVAQESVLVLQRYPLVSEHLVMHCYLRLLPYIEFKAVDG